MIIQAKKANLEFSISPSCDAEIEEMLIDALDELANIHFDEDEYNAQWKGVDEMGPLCFMAANGWALSISQ